MKTMKINGKKVSVLEYTRRTNAFNALYSSHRGHGLMLGDNGKFWLCRLSDCTRLERVGYEWAK